MHFAEHIKKSRIISLWSMVALALVLVLNWVVSGAKADDVHILAVQLLPFFMFWPGLVRGKTGAYFWLCVVLMVYATKAVIGVMAAPSILAILELTITLFLFLASYYYVRWVARSAKAAAQKPDTTA